MSDWNWKGRPIPPEDSDRVLDIATRCSASLFTRKAWTRDSEGRIGFRDRIDDLILGKTPVVLKKSGFNGYLVGAKLYSEQINQNGLLRRQNCLMTVRKKWGRKSPRWVRGVMEPRLGYRFWKVRGLK